MGYSLGHFGRQLGFQLRVIQLQLEASQWFLMPRMTYHTPKQEESLP